MNRQKLTTAAVNLAWAAIAALMWLPSSHAELTATPEEHDFGEVTLGESSTAYVTITNVGRRYTTNEQIVIVAHPSPSFSSSLYLEFVDIEHSEPEELVRPATTPPHQNNAQQPDCSPRHCDPNHLFTIDDSQPTQILALDTWCWGTPDCPRCASPVEEASWGTVKALYR